MSPAQTDWLVSPTPNRPSLVVASSACAPSVNRAGKFFFVTPHPLSLKHMAVPSMVMSTLDAPASSELSMASHTRIFGRNCSPRRDARRFVVGVISIAIRLTPGHLLDVVYLFVKLRKQLVPSLHRDIAELLIYNSAYRRHASGNRVHLGDRGVCLLRRSSLLRLLFRWLITEGFEGYPLVRPGKII